MRVVVWILVLALLALGLVLDHRLAGPRVNSSSSEVTFNGNSKSF